MRHPPLLATMVAAAAAFAQPASAQAPGNASPAAAQMIGLFTQTCVQFAGRPEALRDFLGKRGVPELNEAGKAIFLRERKGVGFDASNKVTRLALVSENNGTCTAFMGEGSNADIVPQLHSFLKGLSVQATQVSDEQKPEGRSVVDRLTIGDRAYLLVISTNNQPAAPIQAAVTLSPAAP